MQNWMHESSVVLATMTSKGFGMALGMHILAGKHIIRIKIIHIMRKLLGASWCPLMVGGPIIF